MKMNVRKTPTTATPIVTVRMLLVRFTAIVNMDSAGIKAPVVAVETLCYFVTKDT